MLPHLDPVEHPHSHRELCGSLGSAGEELGQAFRAGGPTEA